MARNDDRAPMSHVEDYELARGALRGCEAETGLFLERMLCVPRILRAQNQRLNGRLSKDELDDVTQDTLLIAWKKLEGFEGRASLETWVFGICRLEFLNAVRRKRRDDAEPMEGAKDTLMDQELWGGRGASMDAALACAALEEIGPPTSDVIRMKHFEHLTFVEIGERLGLPKNTIKSHYRRGLARLRKFLGLGRGEAA